MRRRCDTRLIERYGNHLVTSQVPHVAHRDEQVVPRLPLNVQRLIEGIRQFIRPVVIREGKQRLTVCNGRGVWQDDIGGIPRGRRSERIAPRIVEGAAGGVDECPRRGRGGITGGNETLVIAADG